MWAFVGVLGCATHRLPPVAGAPTTEASAPRVDVADLTRPLRVVERLPDGTMRLLCGGVRAEVRPDRVTLADESFNAPIARALHLAHGWLFVAADGTTAHGDAFLGPLRRLEALTRPETVAQMPQADGRASAVDTLGRVVFSDGVGLSVAGPAQTPLPAVRASFVDPLRGWAALESGESFATTDGGAHWHYAGSTQVDSFPTPAAADELLSTVSDAVRARLRAALFARNPAYLSLLRTTRLPDGSVLAEDGESLVEVSPWGEQRNRVAPITMSMLVSERHGVDLGGYQVYSADLASAASLEPPRYEDVSELRVGGVNRARRIVETSRVVDELAGLDSERAWGWADCTVTHRTAVQIDLASGRVDDLLPADFGASCRTGVCEFAPDGTLFAVAAGRMMRVDHGARSETAMPDGATRVTFADAQRGMAYGGRRDRVWLTRDGARSWQAVDLGGPIGQWSTEERGASCTPLGCFLAGVAIEGFDASRLRVRSLGVASARELPARWMPPWFEHMPGVRCATEGTVELPAWTGGSQFIDRLSGPAGQERCVERHEAGQVGDSSYSTAREWRGLDADGPFHGLSGWRRGRRCEPHRVVLQGVAGYIDRMAAVLAEYGVLGIYRPTAVLGMEHWVRWFVGRTQVFLTRHVGQTDYNLLGDHPYQSQTLTEGEVVLSPAVNGEVIGAVYWIAREPDRARFVPRDRSTAGENVDIPSPETLGPCAGLARRGALRVAAPMVTSGRGNETDRGWATVEIADGTACIRDVQSVHGYASLAWPDASGGLTGVAYGAPASAAQAETATRLRCTLVAPE